MPRYETLVTRIYISLISQLKALTLEIMFRTCLRIHINLKAGKGVLNKAACAGEGVMGEVDTKDQKERDRVLSTALLMKSSHLLCHAPSVLVITPSSVAGDPTLEP